MGIFNSIRGHIWGAPYVSVGSGNFDTPLKNGWPGMIVQLWVRFWDFLITWVAPCVGVVLAIAFYLLVFDRQPPFVRLYGSIIPEVVERSTDPDNPSRIAVRYITTKRIPGRDCPGDVEQEFLDEEGRNSNRPSRDAVPAKWEPHPTDPDKEIFTGHPVAVPVADIGTGQIRFRTVSKRACNFLQRWFPYWSVIQSGPDLFFTLTKPGVEQTK